MHEDPVVVLRAHDLHVTAQRVAILKVVSANPHASADDVARLAAGELGSISRQAVYDSLGVLTDHGILRRIQPEGSPTLFEARAGDNHHHLVCRDCGRLADVDCAVGYTPCLEAQDCQGFEVEEAEVVYWGRCPDCLVPSPSRATST